MNKKSLIMLALIVILGIALRFWQLGKVPVSPDWDEVSLGYNAYSIMHTGRDEYGQFLPIVMRSFDDYKPALYSYLTIPSIAVFGVDVFAVRFPSAFFGALTLIAVYFLLKELFKESAFKVAFAGFDFDIPILGTLMLAISPWHIQFSRVAFESNIGLSFNIFAALFFLKGLKKPWLLSLSAFFAAMAIYVYQSEKVFTPLFIVALVLIYWKQLFALPKKYIFTAAVVGLILALPMAGYTLTNKNALERAQGVSIFTQASNSLSENTKRLLVDSRSHDLLGLLIDNRRVLFAREVASGYLSHFDLNWLFINGDIARHHAPNMGLLYIFELSMILIGIYYLIFGPFSKKTKIFIFSWFLLVPIPASVTTGVPHAVRTLNFLPTFQIFTSVGILAVLMYMKNFKWRRILVVLGIAFAIFNFVYFVDQYFVQLNYFDAGEWQYGYEKIMPQVQKEIGSYKKIVVSNQAPMDQSYMFFLFYLKYPPELYQKESLVASGGFRENHKFGNFEFRPIDWNVDQKLSNTLFVGRPTDFPKGADSVFNVNYPSGAEAIKIVK